MSKIDEIRKRITAETYGIKQREKDIKTLLDMLDECDKKLSIAREALDRIGVRTEVSVDIKTEDCMKTDLDRIKELASQALEKLK